GPRRQVSGTAHAGRAGAQSGRCPLDARYLERTHEKDTLKGAEVAARALGVRLQFVEARGPEDFDRAFSDMTSAGVGALTVLPGLMLLDERRRLVDLAAKNRLPACRCLGPYGLWSERP